MLGVLSETITMTAHTSQQDQHVYRITLWGQIDEELVEAYFPTGTVLALARVRRLSWRTSTPINPASSA